jgi:orotidine-5'-phosphate decarboxylase
MTTATRNIAPRERVIVALDLPSVKSAETLCSTLGDAISFYKIGYQLGSAGGLAFAQDLIGNTVNKGVENIVNSGATFLTVHAYPQTMKAALDASRASPLKILAVTILTSYNDADVTEAGYVGTARDQVKRKSEQACALGIDGIVCSAEESEMLRPIVGPDRLLVTPGRRRERRPEADHDTRRRDPGGLGLSRGRPSDHGSRRSEGRGRCDRA